MKTITSMTGIRTTLREGVRYVSLSHQVMLVDALNDDVVVACGGRRDGNRIGLSRGWCGLLLADRTAITVLGGSLQYETVQVECLIKLLAFLDEARRPTASVPKGPSADALSFPDLSPWRERRLCEAWFARQVMMSAMDVAPLLGFLRRTESYSLIRFLLAQSAMGEKLQNLCQQYGVSYSHFRRLCCHALGHSAKTDMRDWRMARALLEVAGSHESLTEIALRHGYSSSSHFSSEVKGLTGRSPRELTGLLASVVG